MDVKLILIPIDFSNHCKLALNYAVSIAHKFGEHFRNLISL